MTIPLRAAICVLILAGTGAMGVPVAAQDESSVAVGLLGQPAWHRPGDRLGISLRVVNQGIAPIDGFVLRIDAHARSSSRTGLHEAFGGDPGFAASSFSVAAYAETELAPAEGITVEVDDPVNTLASITPTSEGGVYPVTITILDPNFEAELDSLITPLIYYPEPPERPLNLVPVVPIAALPSRAPSGAFVAVDPTGSALDHGLEPGGWLDGLIGAVEANARAGLSLGLAPLPRLVEELADMADGYTVGLDGEQTEVQADAESSRRARIALDRLGAVLDESTVQGVLSPYAWPDLPALARDSSRSDGIARQITAGEQALASSLGTTFDRYWLVPPEGRVDPASLEQLHLADAGARIFVASEALEELITDAGTVGGCPEDVSPTFACPLTIRSGGGSFTGYVADDGLQDRLAALVESATTRARQEFLAETAMIHAELPGTERVVQATFPALWEPPPALASSVLSALRRAPWLRTLRPDQGLRRPDLQPRTRALSSDIPVDDGAAASIFQAVDGADDLVESVHSVGAPEDLVQRLETNLLTAESRLWWTDAVVAEQGRAYATQTEERSEAELGSIRVGVPRQVTLTSERGSIELFVFNDAAYPMRVSIHLESPGLTFDTPVQTTIVPPPGQQVPVNVTAESSGIFPLQVTITTPEPDGREIARSSPVQIRSTTFNDIALGITIGALAFLILFYAIRGWRRRVAARDQQAPA